MKSNYDKYKRSPKRSNFLTKKKALAFLVALGVITAGLWALDTKGIIDLPFLSAANDSAEAQNGDINYGPPSAEEKQETEDFKAAQGQKPADTSAPPNQAAKKTATPVISSWGQNPQTKDIEVSAFVSDVYEEGGTCTLTLERNGQKVSEAKSAILNAQNISCGFITISRNKLTAGTWQARVSYSSANAEGTSQAVSLEVE